MIPIRRSLRAFVVLSAALLLSLGFVLAPKGAVAQDMAMGAHPAHIHAGTCAELGDVVFPLSDVGASWLVDGTPMAGEDMMGGSDAIPVMVSVTTVGYGDIVPVSARARLIDALLVTPVRLFIWLIFMGTAYQLVLQQLIEEFRMRRLQAKLAQHVIVCGYGHSGRCAAAELVARGLDKGKVLVVDVSEERLEEAAENGHVGILGDARREETLREAMLPTARALFVCTHRDDTNVLIVLTARHLSATVRIVARVEEAENEKLLRQSGANATVLPSRVGGILMADSLDSSVLAAYVMDLISAGGRVTLIEREARPEEVGRTAVELTESRILRILRGEQGFGFWEAEERIQLGDKLVVVCQAHDAH